MPANIIPQRMAGRLEGEFCVFLIGMRLNRPLKIHKWLPTALAMNRMLRELEAHKELGFLGGDAWFGRTSISLQYWRSAKHLMDYATSKTHAHLPAWRAFTRRVGDSGDVGIWHETYSIKDGAYETIYHNMSPFGLGGVGTLVPATGHYQSAKERFDAKAEAGGAAHQSAQAGADAGSVARQGEEASDPRANAAGENAVPARPAESAVFRCRLVACREALADGKDWSFYLINDSAFVLDSATLHRASYEWGDESISEAAEIHAQNLAPGASARLWREDSGGAEVRIDIFVRVRAEQREAKLCFEFPKLYRQRNLPLAPGLGKPGWQAHAQSGGG